MISYILCQIDSPFSQVRSQFCKCYFCVPVYTHKVVFVLVKSKTVKFSLHCDKIYNLQKFSPTYIAFIVCGIRDDPITFLLPIFRFSANLYKPGLRCGQHICMHAVDHWYACLCVCVGVCVCPQGY